MRYPREPSPEVVRRRMEQGRAMVSAGAVVEVLMTKDGGKSPRSIALALGIKTSEVRAVLASPEFDRLIRQEGRGRMSMAYMKAVDTICEAINEGSVKDAKWLLEFMNKKQAEIDAVEKAPKVPNKDRIAVKVAELIAAKEAARQVHEAEFTAHEDDLPDPVRAPGEEEHHGAHPRPYRRWPQDPAGDQGDPGLRLGSDDPEVWEDPVAPLRQARPPDDGDPAPGGDRPDRGDDHEDRYADESPEASEDRAQA